MKKIVIYQVFPRWFGNSEERQVFAGTAEQNGVGKFNDFTDKVLDEIAAMGITHVWYTGVLRHATPDPYPEIVKGRAGSPYAVIDYYDVADVLAENPDCRMAEFEDLVERTHQAGLKVIIDFVPNHVARNYKSLKKPDGVRDLGEDDDHTLSFSTANDFYYLQGELVLPQDIRPFGSPFDLPANHYVESPAKVTGNDCFTTNPSVNDWYETVKLNYGRNYEQGGAFYMPHEVGQGWSLWQKMLDILLFWASKKVDGFRCDMAEMVPLEFWQWAIPKVKTQFPNLVFIAETYNPVTYKDYIHSAHFDYLYDKVGLYDSLHDVICYGRSTFDLTHCWQAVEGIGEKMLRFLENHDEQRVASRFFAADPWKALPAMLISAAMHKGPVMLYAGQETGEPAEGAVGFSGDDGRTSIFDYTNVPTLQRYLKSKGLLTDHGLVDNKRQNIDDILRLVDAYRKMLTFVRDSSTLATGEFYDVMWANAGRPGMDRCYAFLRHTLEEQLLVLAWFGDERSLTSSVNLHIPRHAFETMGLSLNQHYTLKPLLHHTADLKLTIGNELFMEFRDFTYEIYRFFKN